MSISAAEQEALKYMGRERDFVASFPYGGCVEPLQLKNGKWRAYIKYFIIPWSPRGQKAESKEVVRDNYGFIITATSHEQLIAKLKDEYPGWKWLT